MRPGSRSSARHHGSPRSYRSASARASRATRVSASVTPAKIEASGTLDDPAAAPGWAWLGSIAWLGVYVVLPVWGIWFGARQVRIDRQPVGVLAPSGER